MQALKRAVLDVQAIWSGIHMHRNRNEWNVEVPIISPLIYYY